MADQRVDPFCNINFDERQFNTDLKIPNARKTYAIWFTPRSGSSWLSEILSETKIMGKAGEHFNPNFVPKIARRLNANTIERYVAMITRKASLKSVYSFEITYFQMKKIFGNERRYFEFFPESTPVVYLLRRDIVEQAVSLHKMTQTKVSHTRNATPEQIARSDAEFLYDQDAINRWIGHIRKQEINFERIISNFNINPLRLYYEDNINNGKAEVVKSIADHVGINGIPGNRSVPSESENRKLGTGKNSEYSERFKYERYEFVEELNKARDRFF